MGLPTPERPGRAPVWENYVIAPAVQASRDEPPPPRAPTDFESLAREPIVWEVEPRSPRWFRAQYRGGRIHMRINVRFPDGRLYALPLGGGRVMELDDLPPSWRREGPLEWPNAVPSPGDQPSA